MATVGYTCKCGQYHPAGSYGAAHWQERLLHTCDNCGRQNTIKAGRILKSKPLKLRPAARGQTVTEYCLLIGAITLAFFLAFRMGISFGGPTILQIHVNLVGDGSATRSDSVRVCDDAAMKDCHQ